MGVCSSRAQFIHEPLNDHETHSYERLFSQQSLEARRPLLWGVFGDKSTERRFHDDDGDVQSEVRDFTSESDSTSPNASSDVTRTNRGTTPEVTSTRQSNPFTRRTSRSLQPLAELSVSTNYSESSVSEKLHHGYIGHAFKTRLEKHRLLQASMTSPGQLTASTISPSSVDTDVGSVRSRYGTTRDALVSPSRSVHKTMPQPDHFHETDVTPWTFVERKKNITAIAIGRDESSSLLSKNLVSSSSFIATGDEEGTILVTRMNGIEPHGRAIEVKTDGRIRSLQFTSNVRNHIVAGGDGSSACVFQILKDGESKELNALSLVYKFDTADRIYDVKFSPDDRILAVGGFDGKVYLLSTENLWTDERSKEEESPLTRYLNRSDLVYCLGWSPCGNWLAAGGSSRTYSIYKIDGRREECVFESDYKSSTIQCLQWSPNQKFVAFGHGGTVDILSVYDDESNRFRLRFELDQTPSTEATSQSTSQFRFRVLSLCWSSSSTYFVVGTSDGTCSIVETESFAQLLQVQRGSGIVSMCWGRYPEDKGHKHNYLAVADGTSNLALLKLQDDVDDEEYDDGKNVSGSSNLQAEFERKSHLEATNDDEWVLQDGAFQNVEDAESSQDSLAISESDDTSRAPSPTVQAIAFSKKNATSPRTSSAQSTYLAYACGCALTIMTTRNWKIIFQIEFEKSIRTIAFSHSSNHLALGGDEGILYVLSVPSRSLVLNTVLDSPICSISFSQDDERLSVGLDDGILSLFVVEADWEPTADIDDSDSPVSCQEWSSDAFVVGRMDGTVCIYDAEQALSNSFVTLNQISSNGSIRSVSFGVEGQFLSVAGDTGLLYILSSKGNWVVCNQIDLGRTTLTTAWSPCGQYLTVGGYGYMDVLDTVTWTSLREEVDRVVQTIIRSSQNFDDGDGIKVSRFVGEEDNGDKSDSSSRSGPRLDNNFYFHSADWSLDGKHLAVGGGTYTVNGGTSRSATSSTRQRSDNNLHVMSTTHQGAWSLIKLSHTNKNP